MRLSRMAIVGLGAVATLVALTPTPVGSVECAGNVNFEDVLNRGVDSGVTVARDYLIRNEQQWCEFWDELHRRMFPRPPCDTTLVDFNNEVAIVSALGPRSNTCYGVSIRCVDDRAAGRRGLRVFVSDVIPGPTCACAMATVHPVHVVKVPKPVGQVVFFHGAEILDCSF